MLNKNAKKWVDALRSEKYKQGDSFLHCDDKYCCLGVACDLYAQENELDVVVNPIVTRQNGNFYYLYEGHCTHLPQKVQDWLGLKNRYGGYSMGQLSAHNDMDKWTFHQIADLIESEPEDLFYKERKNVE